MVFLFGPLLYHCLQAHPSPKVCQSPTGCATSCTSRVKWLERVFDGIRGFCDEEALLRNYKQARMEQREIAGSGQRILTLMIPSEGWYDISSRNCSVCEFLLD